MQSYRHFQRLLADLGTPAFPCHLQQWVADLLRLPAIYHTIALRFHRASLRFPSPHQSVPVDVLFSVSSIEPQTIHQALALYAHEGEWRHDILPHLAEGESVQQVIQGAREHDADSAYWALVKRCRLGMECMLLGGDAHAVYTWSLFTRQGQQGFSPQQLAQLREQGPMILTLLSKHAQIMALTGNLQTLSSRFGARLAQCGISLSQREVEVCCGILEGISIEQLAQRLQVRSCTIRTYLERALVKLDLPDKWALFHWSCGVPASSAGSA
ncbi:LuxR C-terminal-related transcriptional regulator [Nissabacter sp. SGAir0207]|uniref:helix-turn-helix transcriptional regulator n=1 Tax=Nissabacter sp. SGAir0207 TaxID=2126321 RepID=UPI0010CCF0C7|nr:LuxR C-terminal-related transcriptional regulator [Nissabacter sp. SGAir0207]QCR35605.1 hypothetical protein C1N62_05635 [Nissabacter sp. SGAir0207]